MLSHCFRLFLGAGAHLLHTTLLEDFGFTKIKWFFSGRRGLHCWITDADARRLTNDLRSAIVHYLTIFNRTDQIPRVDGSFLSQRYEKRAVAVLRKFWPQLLQEQKFFFREGAENQPPEKIKLLEDVLKKQVPGSIIDEIVGEARVQHQWGDNAKFGQFLQLSLEKRGFGYVYDILILACLSPRLDVNVSKEVNHLLKAPFCIHQGTMKVCRPIPVEYLATFDPETVLTVDQLVGAKADATAVEEFRRWADTFMPG